MDIGVVYDASVVKGTTNIAAFLHVSKGSVSRLIDNGAPICVDESGVPRACKPELWAWFKDHHAKLK